MIFEKNNSKNNSALSKNYISGGILMIRSHFSLFIIALGAICFLFTNIILKEILNEVDYGIYSMVITYFSVIYIYGLLGFEQVFMRFSDQSEKNILTTQKIQLKYIFSIALFTSITSVFFYFFYFSEYKIQTNPFLLSVATFSMILTLFLFNIFRLNKEFSFSQIISNGWKILLCLAAIFFLIYNITDLNLFINIILISIIIITIISAFIILKKIKWTYNKELNNKNVFIAFINFFIAISSFSIVLFADRFIIEYKLGMGLVGDYFYLTNFVLAPYSILQNYIGFKQLIHFKEKFNIESFINFNKKIILISIGLSFCLMVFICVLQKLNFLSFDFNKYTSTIGLLFLLGMARLYSASILSAFEAKTDISTLKRANILVVILTIIVSIFVIITFSTLNQIIIGFIVIWFIRSLIFRQLLLKQIQKTV